MTYFRRCYEAPDDTGAALDEPSGAPDEPDETEPAAEVEPEESYTRSQLAEMLPHFDRVATHEGEEAVRQYGQMLDNARRLISQGGHMNRQEEDAYRAAGIDPSEVQIPQQEAAGPTIFGAPWEPPGSWDEYVAYAQSENPDQRRVAAFGVMQSDADEPTKQWFFNQWASADPHGAALYNQQVLIQQQQQMADQIREELREEMRMQYGPVQEKHVSEGIDAMISRASSEIPGFVEHKAGIVTLMQEREQRYPGYTERFNAASLDERVAELDELTTIAAKRFAPQRKAAQAAASSETDAAKRRARTETGRTNGAPETDVDARRRAEREVLKRIGPTIHL